MITVLQYNISTDSFDIRTDVVLEHCCHCYDNLGLRMCFWTKDTRSCSSHGQSDYLRSSFSTEKEYSNLSSRIRKTDCNTNSTIVFNLGALRPVTRVLLVSCTSPGAGKWVEKRVKNWVAPLSKNRLQSKYRQNWKWDVMRKLENSRSEDHLNWPQPLLVQKLSQQGFRSGTLSLHFEVFLSMWLFWKCHINLCSATFVLRWPVSPDSCRC